MITRLYANNFRCLVAFETQFDSFGVLCGPNGAGKSSVFDVLDLIRNLATGVAYLGGESERDVRNLELPTGCTERSRSLNWALPLKGIPLSIFFTLNKSPVPRNLELCESGRHVIDEPSLSEILKACAFRKLVTRKQAFPSIGVRPRWHPSNRREIGARSQFSRMRSRIF